MIMCWEVSDVKKNKIDNVHTMLGCGVFARNHCCHGNARMRSLFIVVGVYVALNKSWYTDMPYVY